MKYVLSRLVPYKWRMLLGFLIKVAGTLAELMLPVILSTSRNMFPSLRQCMPKIASQWATSIDPSIK